ncbi:superoxide dismutase family protein [Kitasatospora camelliae]|uniref:Superoxide dismutase family protein n=1 Tax=Kitasatospora camelliae TaxID=3156397 RepID=A0AAU8K860_9ACTN
MRRRTMTATCTALAATLLLAGCGGVSKGAGPTSTASDGPVVLAEVAAEFAGFGDQVKAVTYQEAVPAGARVKVSVQAEGDTGTGFRLDLGGLTKGHAFGAHLHTKPCGAKPADAGPHYQDQADPTSPSTDPAYANDRNEVWLDFTADAEGNATVTRTVDFRPRQGEAGSIVIHAQHTATDHGKAGTAGDRWACVNLPL